MDGVGFRKKLTTNGDLTEKPLKKLKIGVDKWSTPWYNKEKRKEVQRHDRNNNHHRIISV